MAIKEINVPNATPMETSSLIHHRFDGETPHGKFVDITSILKVESMWKL